MLTIQYSQNKNSFLSSKATSDDSFWKPEPNPSSREQILLWRKWSLKAFYFCHKKHEPEATNLNAYHSQTHTKTPQITGYFRCTKHFKSLRKLQQLLMLSTFSHLARWESFFYYYYFISYLMNSTKEEVWGHLGTKSLEDIFWN